MATETDKRDELAKLPFFEWRDQKYPVIARQVSFAHEGAMHRIEYRDNDFIEQLGPHSLVFSYTLPMRQGIASGPYKNLFTTGYQLLFESMRNREKGRLVDPLLGEFLAVPESWADDIDVTKRDGTDVRVEFKHAPDEDEAKDHKPPTIQGLKSDAAALDAQLKTVNWHQEKSPGPSIDALNAISGFGAQLQAQKDKVAAALEDFAYKCEKIDQQIDRLQNPDVWPLKRAVRRNRAASVTLAKRAQDPTQEIVKTTVNYGRTISVLAKEVGMTVADLLAQNPALARSPFVPNGYVINVVKRRAR